MAAIHAPSEGVSSEMVEAGFRVLAESGSLWSVSSAEMRAFMARDSNPTWPPLCARTDAPPLMAYQRCDRWGRFAICRYFCRYLLGRQAKNLAFMRVAARFSSQTSAPILMPNRPPAPTQRA